MNQKQEKLLRMISELVGRPVDAASIIVCYRDGGMAHTKFAVVGKQQTAENVGILCGFTEAASRDLMLDTMQEFPTASVRRFIEGYKDGLRSHPLSEHMERDVRPSGSNSGNLTLDSVTQAIKQLRG